jgi:hypothetical protein
MKDGAPPPRGVFWPAAFFLASGVLDGTLNLVQAGDRADLTMVWTIVGRSLMSAIVAYGLWHRLALSRSIALVYCLASIVTYGVALGLAFARQPVHFPPAVVIGSAFEVPSCVLLFFWLRSREAAALFVRRLF